MELSVAVVGAGKWGKNVVRAFASSDRCRVHALCDRDATCLDVQRNVLPGARLTTRFEDVLADRAVHAVVLATPACTHVELSLAALRAGKDVFVEKPMALDVDAARLLKCVTAETRRHFMVGHILMYHPAVLALEELLAAGYLGEVCYAAAERTGASPRGRDISAWWALAPHDLSVLRRLFRANPTELRAYGHALDGSVGEDVVTARVSFEGGQSAFLHVGALSPAKTRRLTVVGSERIAVFDDLEPRGKLRIYPNEKSGFGWFQRGARWGLDAGDAHAVSDAEPLRLEAQHFIDSVLDGTPVRTDVEDGLQVTRALAAGSRSIAARGEAITLEHIDGFVE